MSNMFTLHFKPEINVSILVLLATICLAIISELHLQYQPRIGFIYFRNIDLICNLILVISWRTCGSMLELECTRCSFDPNAGKALM